MLDISRVAVRGVCWAQVNSARDDRFPQLATNLPPSAALAMSASNFVLFARSFSYRSNAVSTSSSKVPRLAEVGSPTLGALFLDRGDLLPWFVAVLVARVFIFPLYFKPTCCGADRDTNVPEVVPLSVCLVLTSL